MKATGVFLIVMLICGVTLAQETSFWPMFQRDPQHTGLAPVSTSDQWQPLWQTSVTGGFPTPDSHLVLGSDSSIWVVGVMIMRVSPSGEVLGRFSVGQGDVGSFQSAGAPVIVANGCIVAAAQVRSEESVWVPTLYMIQPTGDVVWTLPLEGQPGNALLSLGQDETIYCASDQLVYAISTEGEVVWSYRCEGQATTFPAIASDGTIYFGASNGRLYSLSSEGTLNWTFGTPSPAPVFSAPTIDKSGNVYFVASLDGFYCVSADGSPQFFYPSDRFSYTSPVLLGDGSVVFLGGDRGGDCRIICIGPDGQERYDTPLMSDQDPMSSPVADRDGNVYVGYMDHIDQGARRLHIARIDNQGQYQELLSSISSGYEAVGGLCLGPNGTLFGYMDDALVALGCSVESLSISVQTGFVAMDTKLGSIRGASISLSNPLGPLDADCYIAYRRVGGDELFFYPFWSNEPSSCALEFRPLPAGAQFPKIELVHLQERSLEPGQYQWLAGLFEPGTFNPLCEIASCEFTVFAQPSRGSGLACDRLDGTADARSAQEAAPAIQIWTDRGAHAAGETLHLSLGLENQGLRMPYDLYIAATLDSDTTGTLYFFPTWATSLAFTNIGFLPLAQGASLPALTIMHLELPDSLPRGTYRFLAAFFQAGTFELAGEISEAHWTLM